MGSSTQPVDPPHVDASATVVTVLPFDTRLIQAEDRCAIGGTNAREELRKTFGGSVRKTRGEEEHASILILEVLAEIDGIGGPMGVLLMGSPTSKYGGHYA